MQQHNSRSLQGLLTEEELEEMKEKHRKQLLRKYLASASALATDLDVQLFLAALNEPKVGTKVMCGNHLHTSPFRALSDVLRDISLYYVIWGSRSGSKTYLFGGLDTWYKSATRGRLETKILGGSEGQSLLSYEALKRFKEICDEDGVIAPKLLTTKAVFSNGSTVSILTASTKSVRGPHPQILKLDEVDEIDSKVYDDALSQPQSKYGHPASLGMFSTNHNVAGQMDLAINNALDKGHDVYRYCVWETLESCRDYICETCKLSVICPGEQMKEADGYYIIEDFIRKMETLNFSALSRDWLCIKKGLGDTVYEQEWDEEIHIITVPLQDRPVVLSLDWGGVDPFTAGVWQRVPDTDRWGQDSWVRVTELYMTSEKESATNNKFIKKARQAPWWKWIREVVPDNSRPDLIQEWRAALPHAKFTVVDKGTIDSGIEAVKDALSPALGIPKLYFNRICMHTRREMVQYKVKNEKPVDKNNHTCDEIRYFVIAKIKRVETSCVLPGGDVSPRSGG